MEVEEGHVARLCARILSPGLTGLSIMLQARTFQSTATGMYVLVCIFVCIIMYVSVYYYVCLCVLLCMFVCIIMYVCVYYYVC